jgi:hypothetical protein
MSSTDMYTYLFKSGIIYICMFVYTYVQYRYVYIFVKSGIYAERLRLCVGGEGDCATIRY